VHILFQVNRVSLSWAMYRYQQVTVSYCHFWLQDSCQTELSSATTALPYYCFAAPAPPDYLQMSLNVNVYIALVTVFSLFTLWKLWNWKQQKMSQRNLVFFKSDYLNPVSRIEDWILVIAHSGKAVRQAGWSP